MVNIPQLKYFIIRLQLDMETIMQDQLLGD